MSKEQVVITAAPPSWRLRKAVLAVIRGLRRGRWVPVSHRVSLSISCVGAREMTRLNLRYRGKRGPTDVLSFEQPDSGPRGVIFLGDLVLCREVVRAQARERGHGTRDESVVLLVHGILHLLGYDHERSTSEARRMAQAEQRLLKLSGFSGLRAGLIERVKVKNAHVADSKRR